LIGGGTQAGVLGTDARLDVANAAFLNCFTSAVHTFDDTHLASIAHPTGPVAAGALAVAEHRMIGGTEFLNNLFLGIETTCRVGSALMVPPVRTDLNLFMTGLAGVFGAAVAVLKLLRLGPREMVHALGIASTQAAGLREMHGTMCSGARSSPGCAKRPVGRSAGVKGI
jgi:2-methylcitrate dehydratase PrpD